MAQHINKTEVDSISKEVTVFSNLSEPIQKQILEQKNIIFQGNYTNLQEILTPLEYVDLDEIIDSNIYSKLLKNETIIVGKEICPLDDLVQYYVPRTLSELNVMFAESFSEETICQLHEYNRKEIITISGAPGEGKSTLLTNIANTIKRDYPNLWVFEIDLNNYLKSFWEFKKNNLRPITLLDLVNSRTDTQLSDFEQKIFSIPEKVIIIIDGVDEACLNYKDVVVDLIADCVKRRKCGDSVKNAPNYIYMAASVDIFGELEMPFCYALKPLSQRNQIDFVSRYWEEKLQLNDIQKEKCRDFAKGLMKETGCVWTPLQIHMAIEIFEKKENFGGMSEWEGLYDFLNSTSTTPQLPNKITLTELYQLYIYKKCSGNTSTSLKNAKSDIAKINMECDWYLYILALESVLTIEQCHYFNCYKNRVKGTSEEKVLTFGILKKRNDQVSFTHRSFAEYFIAECISLELLKSHSSQNKEFPKFFVEKVLISNQFSLVRTFIDNFIQTIVNSVPNETLEVIGHISRDIVDNLLYTSAKDGTLNILILLFKCFSCTNIPVHLNDVRVNNELPLHFATKGCHDDVVKFLVEHGANVNSRNEDDRTALHLAAKKGSFSIMKFLVEHGADVKCKDGGGKTILHKAVKRGSLEMMKYLLANEADVNGRCKYGYTILHKAMEQGDLDKVKCLVENEAEINCRGMYGGRVLSKAVETGDLNIVRYLIENGADVTVRNSSDGTMLHTLANINSNMSIQKSTEMAQFLIDKGVDVNSVDGRGETVLHTALNKQTSLDFIQFLVDNGVDIHRMDNSCNTPLDKAIDHNDLTIVKYLMEKGVQFNKNSNYSEALDSAVLRQRLPLLKYLSEKGLSLDVETDNGCSLIHRAVWNGHFEIVKFLVEKGMKVDGALFREAVNSCNLDMVKLLVENGPKTDEDFCEGTRKGSLDVVKFLMERGCSFGVVESVEGNLELLQYLLDKGVEVNTPLVFYEAASEGNIGKIRLLLGKGVDVNSKDKNGRTALHRAVASNNFQTVKFLIKRGALASIKDDSGSTPLHETATHGYFDAAKLLVDSGADVNERDGRDDTALHLAVTNNHLDIVQLLVKRGAQINVINERGDSPVSRTFSHCHFNILEFFAQQDPDVNRQVEEALKGAGATEEQPEYNWRQRPGNLLDVIFYRLENIKYLLSKGMEITNDQIKYYKLIHRAAGDGDVKLIKYIIEKGGDVKSVDKFGGTALYDATDLSVIKFLVQNGDDVNCKARDGPSLLCKMVEDEKKIEVCKFLVESGADVNEEDENGYTLLHVAATRNFCKFKYLLEKGAKLKLARNGRSVLHEAIATGFRDFDTIKYLIANGEDVNCKDNDGRTPIDEAVDRDELDVVKLLVENGVDVSEVNLAAKVLCAAVSKNDLDLVKYLVVKGAGVNVKSENGSTPLHVAASNQNYEIVKFLVESDAEVNVVDKNGRSPLHEAVKREGGLYVAKLLIGNGADFNIEDKNGRAVLHDAAGSGDYYLIQCLIEHGASPNAKARNGRTILHETAASGCLSAVRLFVETGADVNISDKDGYTPLLEATRNSSFFGSNQFLDVMKFLLENGANVNIKSRNGRTPLHEAAALCALNKVELLVENGADLNARDEYGRTAIFAGIMENKRNRISWRHNIEFVVEFLAKAGADLAAKADNERTALHEASIAGNLSAVESLVKMGVDVNVKTGRGRTALHDAARRGMLNVVKYLVDNGAEVDVKTVEGTTPFDEATKGKHDNVVEFLRKREPGHDGNK